MRRLTTEELAQVLLIKETLAEMHGEVNDMPDEEVHELKYRLGLTWARAKALLARYDVDNLPYPPAPPRDNVPF